MSAEAIILLVSGLVTVIGTLIAATATIILFVTKQFSLNRDLMWKAITEASKDIILKLEYHEQHDDKRFEARDKRIWALEMWKATVTRQIPVEFPTDGSEH